MNRTYQDIDIEQQVAGEVRATDLIFFFSLFTDTGVTYGISEHKIVLFPGTYTNTHTICIMQVLYTIASSHCLSLVWHKAESIVYPVRIELINNGLLA